MQVGEGEDEIDWGKVDTDSLERDAIASTPGSSQRLQSLSGEIGTDTTTLQEKLRDIASETPTRGDMSNGKRKRDEEPGDLEKTPKRALVDASEVRIALLHPPPPISDLWSAFIRSWLSAEPIPQLSRWSRIASTSRPHTESDQL